MRKYILLLFVAIFVLLSSSCHAQGIESYDLSFSIAYNKVVVKETIVLENPLDGNFLLDLPQNIEALSVRIDGQSAEPQLIKNTLNLELSSSEEIEISYVTEDFLERTDFIAMFKAPNDIAELSVRLTLPEHAALLKPISEATLGSGSVYPKPSRAGTDGLSITLEWDFEGIKKGDEKSFFVRYAPQASYSYILVLVIVIILLIAGFTAFILMRKPKIKEVEKVVEKIVEKPIEKTAESRSEFGKHLKEDEEQIVNILRQREGQCEQGTLRVITGFSKAKLSGLIKELEDRKVVYKEKRGKKNLVFLREQ